MESNYIRSASNIHSFEKRRITSNIEIRLSITNEASVPSSALLPGEQLYSSTHTDCKKWYGMVDDTSKVVLSNTYNSNFYTDSVFCLEETMSSSCKYNFYSTESRKCVMSGLLQDCYKTVRSLQNCYKSVCKNVTRLAQDYTARHPRCRFWGRSIPRIDPYPRKTISFPWERRQEKSSYRQLFILRCNSNICRPLTSIDSVDEGHCIWTVSSLTQIGCPYFHQPSRCCLLPGTISIPSQFSVVSYTIFII